MDRILSLENHLSNILRLYFSTLLSSSGLMTGDSTNGEGGSIEIATGTSSGDFDGANIQISAGEADNEKTTGGTVTVFAGHGTSDDKYDGGNGGSIELIAGSGHGRNKDKDGGGDIHLQAGYAVEASGGNVFVKSGPSIEGDSGDVTIASDNSGKWGESGMLNITTGYSRESSGRIDISTGDSHAGNGGDIQLAVGDGKEGDGGDLIAVAGSTRDMECEYVTNMLLDDKFVLAQISHMKCSSFTASFSLWRLGHSAGRTGRA